MLVSMPHIGAAAKQIQALYSNCRRLNFKTGPIKKNFTANRKKHAQFGLFALYFLAKLFIIAPLFSRLAWIEH